MNKITSKTGANNQNKVQINSDQMSLWSIANDLDCENDNIFGIANLLFCAGNSVGELNSEALYALGNNLYEIYEKLKDFSERMAKLCNDKVQATLKIKSSLLIPCTAIGYSWLYLKVVNYRKFVLTHLFILRIDSLE